MQMEGTVSESSMVLGPCCISVLQDSCLVLQNGPGLALLLRPDRGCTGSKGLVTSRGTACYAAEESFAPRLSYCLCHDHELLKWPCAAVLHHCNLVGCACGLIHKAKPGFAA